MESISSSNLINLSQELKPCVWLIIAYKDDKIYGHMTGFGVKSDGLIMSCAHEIHQDSLPNLVFRASILEGDDIVYNATIVSQKPQWDMTLFQIDGIEDVKVVKLGNGLVDEGDTVSMIGHPLGLVGSFLVGHCCFKCSDVDVSKVHDDPPKDDMPSSIYESIVLNKTAAYRVIGYPIHWSNKIHPLVPIVQCKILNASPGSSVAPLFNAQGELIGMHILYTSAYSICIHVSLIKEFLRIASLNSSS